MKLYDVSGIKWVVQEKEKVSCPNDIVKVLFDKIAFEEQENFCVITLDGAHQIIESYIVSKGLVNRTMIHPREVFRPAISDNAVAVVIAHNHPSGNTEPSNEDNEVTARIKKAGELLGISVLDHVIISRQGYYSYMEEEVM